MPVGPAPPSLGPHYANHGKAWAMAKLIIGYDGTEHSDDALAFGRLMAEMLAAQPVVVSIATWPSYLMSGEQLEQAVRAELDPMLELAADHLRGLDPAVRAVRSRSVSAGLTAAAVEEEAIAIVIGSSHHGAVGRVALGSVGTSLVHGAPCAIAVAPRGFGEEDERRLLRIAVGFDGTPEAWSALEAAIGMAERAHARLTVLTVADSLSFGLGPAWSAISAGELVRAEEKDKQRILNLAVARIPATIPVDARLLTGAAGGLLSEASGEFDLMIVGSRGYGPIGRTFLGSVATHLIHSAGCAVLVLPRGAGADPFRLDDRLGARVKAPA